MTTDLDEEFYASLTEEGRANHLRALEVDLREKSNHLERYRGLLAEYEIEVQKWRGIVKDFESQTSDLRRWIAATNKGTT